MNGPVSLTGQSVQAAPIRLGLSTLFVRSFFSFIAAAWLNDLVIHTHHSIDITQRLIRGDLDIACMFENPALTGGVAALVVDEMEMEFVWARAPDFTLHPDLPVPVLTWPDGQRMVETLDRRGRAYKIVFNSPNYHEKLMALEAGLGIAALPKCLIPEPLVRAEEYDLPPLPSLKVLLCATSGARNATSEKLLAELSDRLFHAPLLAPSVTG